MKTQTTTQNTKVQRENGSTMKTLNDTQNMIVTQVQWSGLRYNEVEVVDGNTLKFHTSRSTFHTTSVEVSYNTDTDSYKVTKSKTNTGIGLGRLGEVWDS